MRCDVPAAGHFLFFFPLKKKHVRWINRGGGRVFFSLHASSGPGRIIQWLSFVFLCMYVMFCTITLRQRPCKSWTVRLSPPHPEGGAYVFVTRGTRSTLCEKRKKKKQLPDTGGIRNLAGNKLLIKTAYALHFVSSSFTCYYSLPTAHYHDPLLRTSQLIHVNIIYEQKWHLRKKSPRRT